jgi:hypothetical protein
VRRGESIPNSDIANVAHTLAAEKECDDQLAQNLLSQRVRAIQRLLDCDDIWARVEAVAVALVDRGELSGHEVEALVDDADQRPLRRLYSEILPSHPDKAPRPVSANVAQPCWGLDTSISA